MCISGQITYVADNERTILEPGDVADVPIPVAHTFLNEGTETAYFIEFKSVEFDKQNPDTYVKPREDAQKNTDNR